MGGQASKSAGLSSESIEKYYAALAAEHEAQKTRPAATDKNENEAPGHYQNDSATPKSTNTDAGMKEPVTSRVEDPDSSDPLPSDHDGPQAHRALSSPEAVEALRNAIVPTGTFEAATYHLLIAVRAFKTKTQDALDIAIATLKKIDAVAVAKAVLNWIKQHPWETAAIVVPLVLLPCTPFFLGLPGFTSGGIVAGSIAAGIQAGIGNVAAGSVFATLTSAGMAGYGLPIVLGGIWGTFSAGLWATVAWMRHGTNADGAAGSAEDIDETEENDESPSGGANDESRCGDVVDWK